MRTYSELILLPTFEERFEYLRLSGSVGAKTFGSDRYLNQLFYNSEVWKAVRRKIIIRDDGCDLAMDGYEIADRIIIHHMNPITLEELVHGSNSVIDPEFLICVSYRTHRAIHYSDAKQTPQVPIQRHPGDTVPWR